MDIAGVDVEIDVIRELPELEDLEVNPSTEDQSFNSSKYGFKNVIIKGITGDKLDLNPSLEQQNLKGVFTEVNINPIQTKKLNTTPTTQEQVITGLFDEVTVNAIEGQELNLNPSEEQQNFEGVFLGVNINPIQVEEITTDLDFSSSDAMELTAQEGVYIKKTTINKPTNLTPENIKSGETVCGIAGINADTSDADATSNDIMVGKTAYVGNEKIQGTYTPLDTSDATATSGDIIFPKTAYVNGEKIEGTIQEYDGSFEGNTAEKEENAVIDVSISPHTYSSGSNNDYLKQLLTKIPYIDTSKIENIDYFFYRCFNLEEIQEVDAQSASYFTYVFEDCRKVTKLLIKNTSNIRSYKRAFRNCLVLEDISLLDGSKTTDISSVLSGCNSLKNFNGFVNLGKAYTQKTINYSSYKLDLSSCSNLTHESLINIMNNLYDLNLAYDVANGGTLYTQSLTLGSTNLAKLKTAEEIAIATNKGWTVS